MGTTVKIPLNEFPHFLKVICSKDEESSKFASSVEHVVIFPDSISVERASKLFGVPTSIDFVRESHELDNRHWNFEVQDAAEALAKTMVDTYMAMHALRFSAPLRGTRVLPNLKSLHIGPSKGDSATGQFLHDDKWVSPYRYTMSMLDNCPWDRARGDHDTAYNLIKAARQDNFDVVSQLIKSVPASCTKTMSIPSGVCNLTIPIDVDDLISNHNLELWVNRGDVDTWLTANIKRLSGWTDITVEFRYDTSKEAVIEHGRQRAVSCRAVEKPLTLPDSESDSGSDSD